MNAPEDQNTPQDDHGQEPPTPENPVRQRHQLGEPEGQDDVPAPK